MLFFIFGKIQLRFVGQFFTDYKEPFPYVLPPLAYAKSRKMRKPERCEKQKDAKEKEKG